MSIEVVSNSIPEKAVNASNSNLAKGENEDAKLSASENEETQDETLEDSETSETDSSEGEDHEQDNSNEDDEEKESSEGKDKAQKKKGGFQKRIDKLSKKLSEKDQRIKILEELALKAAKPEQIKTEAKVDAKNESLDAKPKAENFDSHEEFVEALTDWKVDQKEKQKEQKAKEAEVKTSFEKQQRDFFTKVNEFKKAKSDYDDVVSEIEDVPLNPGIVDAIITSENGPEIMYEIAKNRDELDRINALPPISAARELGKFLAKIELSSSTSKITTDKKLSKAPAPLTPVGGKGSGLLKKSLSDPNLSQSEYEAIRREQMKAMGA